MTYVIQSPTGYQYMCWVDANGKRHGWTKLKDAEQAQVDGAIAGEVREI